jgi:DNA-binding winged helix-turn-helix (wHTH) protein
MNIILNTNINELYTELHSKEPRVVNLKSESELFEKIDDNDVEAYILDSSSSYFKRAADFIKRNNRYIVVIGLVQNDCLFNSISHESVDSYVILDKYDLTSSLILHAISTYIRTFSTLKKLTTKVKEKISFDEYMYDPSCKILYRNNQQIKHLSMKEGGILEVLASNYNKPVMRNVILERVWKKTDYFACRSFDVYCTYLRNTFKRLDIQLKITNLAEAGLILQPK